jgi:dTDP-4-amino-4,6-dideoxygalactose transaminase
VSGLEIPLVRIMAPVLPSADSIYPYLKTIDSNGIYSNFGPMEQEVRNRFSSHFGIPVDLIATCSNATLGIQGALATSNLSTEISWELPAWTFTATAAATALSGYDAQFADVDAHGRLVPTSDARAIIDVLPFGDEWVSDRLGDELDVIVVDAAASFDALRNIPLRRAKPFAVVLSLHATKILPAGEGGVFISNDASWVKRFHDWSMFGMASGRISSFVGTNAKLSEYSAAVCLASLDDWPRIRSAWASIGDKARRISKANNLSVVTAFEKEFISPYWILVMKSEQEKKDLAKHCLELGIETRDWWESGCQNMEAYKNFKRSDLPNTKKMAETTIALPFHLRLTDSEWSRIEYCLQSFTAK